MRWRYDAHRTSHTLTSLTSIRRQGFKHDPDTRVEAEVAPEAPNKDTNFYRKEKTLGVLGKGSWALGKGVSSVPDCHFGVAYVSVEYSNEAKKVKEKLEGYGYVLLRPLAVHGLY